MASIVQAEYPTISLRRFDADREKHRQRVREGADAQLLSERRNQQCRLRLSFSAEKTMRPLTRFLFAQENAIPEYDAALCEYIFAANGLLRRAQRPGLEAMIPAAPPTRLLKIVEPCFRLNAPRVPMQLVQMMLNQARCQCIERGEFVEVLFYYCWNDVQGWTLHTPPQAQGVTWVYATDTSANSAYVKALVEVHSHHWMEPRFSPDDDRDEVGFRIYGVLGRIFERPELKTRVSVYGDWWEIPASAVFDLPTEVFERYGK